jgi:hypothetical protein
MEGELGLTQSTQEAPEVTLTHVHSTLCLNEAYFCLCPWILKAASNRKGPHMFLDVFINPSIMCLG